MKMPVNRVGASCAARATEPSAGHIDSSNGNATVAPTPRRNVRRGNVLLVRNLIGRSPPSLANGSRHGGRFRVAARGNGPRFAVHLERIALGDLEYERPESVVVLLGVLHDLSHDGHVVVLDAATERVRHELL